MHLQLDSRSVGDVIIVYCKGRVAFGEGLEALSEKVGGLLHANRSVLLDFRGVQAIDAAGLGVLADLAAQAWDSDGELRLCNVPAPVAQVISLTHLAGVLECYDTERDGLASYLGAAAFWRAS